MTQQIFISYKSEYRDFARQVKDIITSWGYRTWFDQDDIPKGAYFRTAIQQGLETSDIVLGIVTPEALQSREVQAEWDFAYSGACRLLLLLHQKVSLPYHLRGVQYIDDTNDSQKSIQELEAALKASDIASSIPFIQPKQTQAAQKPETDPIVLDKTGQANRYAMLQKVQKYWVENVLHHVIGEQGVLSIGMTTVGEAVLKHRDYDDYKFPQDSLKIKQVFDDLQRELLILT